MLQLTVDTSVSGRCNCDVHNGFTLPFHWSARNLLDTACHPRWALGMLRGGSPTLQLFAEVVGQVPRGSTITEVMQQQISDAMTWDDLEWLRAHWRGRLVLKGVSAAEHVRRGLELDVDGVVVFNHGGRQLDGSASTIEMLPGVVEAAQGRMGVLIDSGFRDGADVAKALALGADVVKLGQPTLWWLAAAGQAGAEHAVRLLGDELLRIMALCGAPSVAQKKGRVDCDWGPWHEPATPPRATGSALRNVQKALSGEPA